MNEEKREKHNIPTINAFNKKEVDAGLNINGEKQETKEVIAEEKVETAKTVFGTVVDCYRLNIRSGPSIDAEVLCEIPVDTKVKILESEFTEDFYKVVTGAGVEGYCLKTFIKIEEN